MKSNSRSRFIVVSVILLVILLVTLYSLRAVVREAIVVPISYWVWVIGLFVNATPQAFFYVMALVIAGLMAYRSFKVKIIKREPPQSVPDIGVPSGRVSYWVERVNLMRLGPYYQTAFNEALARMALDLLLYRNRIGNRELERSINSGALRLPTTVRDFLFKFALHREYTPVNFFTYLYRSLRLQVLSFIHRKKKHKVETLTPEAQSIIQYMEEELEVRYAPTPR